MPIRATTLFALLATLVVLGPFCGAFAAVACSGECCCGHSRLSSSCEEGACLMSQPGSLSHAVLKAPETLVVAAVVLHGGDAVETMAAVGSEKPAPVEYSPPDIFLSTQQFLI
jgi:hypothetical protein